MECKKEVIVLEKPYEWIEADPLPEECLNCREEECYNCDYAGKRWYLPEEDSLRLRKKGLLHTIDRLNRRLMAIPDSDSEIRQKVEADLTWYRQVYLEAFGEIK